MITIKQWMEACNYSISDGSYYGWDCFGHDAWLLSGGSRGQIDKSDMSIVYNQNTQEVFAVEVHDYVRGNSYRFFAPRAAEAYKAEALRRGVPDEAYDGIKFIDLETAEDWLEKATAIYNGEDYDDRVVVPVNLSDSDAYALMKMAHEEDMTFNDFICKVLEERLAALASVRT